MTEKGSIQKRDFIEAAEIVRNILLGNWTNEPPTWASRHDVVYHEGEGANYVRAVQTAEAFITLFRSFNTRFDQSRFLVACGLAEPVKKGKKA